MRHLRLALTVVVGRQARNRSLISPIATLKAILSDQTGHSDPVWSLAWNADGRCALSGSYDKTVLLWDMEAGYYLCARSWDTRGLL